MKIPILPTMVTTSLIKEDNPKVLIFIKPWDDEVYARFLTMFR